MLHSICLITISMQLAKIDKDPYSIPLLQFSHRMNPQNDSAK